MARRDVSTAVPARPLLRTLLQLWGERLGVLLIVLGIAGLIQPWQLSFFTYGFSVLLVGTIVFIITSHL